jgi:hypothetical protein
VDELIISGKKYISSKRASEITGYAKDYVGQLARSGKIPATRVGRAWYVDESKLISHENSEGEQEGTQIQQIPKAESPIESPFSRVQHTKQRTFTNVSHALAVAPKDFQKTWSRIRYFEDDAVLFPAVQETHDLSASLKREEDKIISDSRESNPVRLRVLQNSLNAHVQRSAFKASPETVPASKPKSMPISAKTKTKIHSYRTSKLLSGNIQLAFLTLAIFLLSGGILASGLLISSHLAISEGTGAYTANALFSYENAREVMASSPILQGGIHALIDFFSTIFNSFWVLFSKGLQFLFDLVHLV